MGCATDISLKSLIVDCDGCPSLSVEASDTISVATSVPLSCLQQDLDVETLINLLLNTEGTAIKTVTS